MVSVQWLDLPGLRFQPYTCVRQKADTIMICYGGNENASCQHIASDRLPRVPRYSRIRGN